MLCEIYLHIMTQFTANIMTTVLSHAIIRYWTNLEDDLAGEPLDLGYLIDNEIIDDAMPEDDAERHIDILMAASKRWIGTSVFDSSLTEAVLICGQRKKSVQNRRGLSFYDMLSGLHALRPAEPVVGVTLTATKMKSGRAGLRIHFTTLADQRKRDDQYRSVIPGYKPMFD